MTPGEAVLIRDSFAIIRRSKAAVAKIFYEYLFRNAPEVRALFKADIGEQQKKFMETLSVAVATVDNLSKIAPILEALAKRHREYGVQDRYYSVVGLTLIQTLESCMGSALTPEAKAAWVRLYGEVTTVMRKSAV